MRWVIVHGDPIGGIDIIGPYDEHEEAVQACERSHLRNELWWVVGLGEPAELEGS